MAANSRIEWCHDTFNPWEGCTKVGPGCDNCYAEARAKRYGSVEWGAGKPRRLTSAANWKKPLQWNKKAEAEGKRRRVFCASLADVFDNEVPEAWRYELFDLIERTPHLDWLLLTKRIGNVEKLLPPRWLPLPKNVWLGATVVNQAEADRDIPKLLATPARVRFLSMEPLLGPVDLKNLRVEGGDQDVLTGYYYGAADSGGHPTLDWVIVGGESGPGARPMHPDWTRSLRDQCAAAGVPFFFKQWGVWAPGEVISKIATRTENTATWFDKKWLFQEMTPRAMEEGHRDDEPDLYRVGKKAAGRWLDGRTHDEFPDAAFATARQNREAAASILRTGIDGRNPLPKEFSA